MSRYELLLEFLRVASKFSCPPLLTCQCGGCNLRGLRKVFSNLYLYLNICNIALIFHEKTTLSHGTLCHWTFPLGHRINLHCHSSTEQMIPPVFQIQPSPLELTKLPNNKWVMPIYVYLQSSQFNLPWSQEGPSSCCFLSGTRLTKCRVLILHFNLGHQLATASLKNFQFLPLFDHSCTDWVASVLTLKLGQILRPQTC